MDTTHLIFLYVGLQFVNPGGPPEQICRRHGQLLHDGFDLLIRKEQEIAKLENKLDSMFRVVCLQRQACRS
jgi:hypothetical protein